MTLVSHNYNSDLMSRVHREASPNVFAIIRRASPYLQQSLSEFNLILYVMNCSYLYASLS